MSNFYKDKTVLVTGHTGFKGSWLSIWLIELGAKVIGYSLDPLYDNSIFIQTNLSEKLVDVRGDIRDFENLTYIFQKYKPDIVFHLAAQPLVRESYNIPRYTYETNVMGTVNVLECIRLNPNTKSAVIITSDKCYENVEKIWGYREYDKMGGHDPYSSSKGAAELVVSAYIRSFFFENGSAKIASARAGNVIGGGDFAVDRIVPDCVKAIKNDNSIEIRNRNAIRPWQHVLEPLSGYLLLGEKLYNGNAEYQGGWNFGPNSDSIRTVYELSNKIINYWGKGTLKLLDLNKKNKLHEAKLLSLDCTKAYRLLNWEPVWDFERTIEMTVDWYKLNSDFNKYDYTVSQINHYIKSRGEKKYD